MSMNRLPLVVLSAAAIALVAGGVPYALGSDAHGEKPKPAAAPAKAPTKPAAKDDDDGHAPETKPETKHETKPEAKPAAKPAPKATKDDDGDERPAAKPAARKSEPEPTGPVTADSALKMLQDGNARWVAGQPTSPNTDTARRATLAENGQKPFAAVLTCADSRLPVERLFDRGVGDLFVVRVAGNVVGVCEAGTVEYGVEHLKAPLLVIMGHTKCGAVAAAVTGKPMPGQLGELIADIAPAVDRAKRNNPDADEQRLAALAVRENVWQQIFTLIKHSPEVREAMGKGELKVVGAICDITTGKVEFLGEHPWQTELVDAMNAREQKRQTAEVGHGE